VAWHLYFVWARFPSRQTVCELLSGTGQVDLGDIVLGTVKCSRLSTIRAWGRPVLNLVVQMDCRLDGSTLMHLYRAVHRR